MPLANSHAAPAQCPCDHSAEALASPWWNASCAACPSWCERVNCRAPKSSIAFFPRLTAPTQALGPPYSSTVSCALGAAGSGEGAATAGFRGPSTDDVSASAHSDEHAELQSSIDGMG